MKLEEDIDYKKLINRKELEVNALLEITQAINTNLPEESLYKIFNFTLRSNLQIKKLALFVFDKAWLCKVLFGTKKNYAKIKLDHRIERINNIHKIEEFPHSEFDEFDWVIPVSHKSETLALVFVGGIENEINWLDTSIKFIQALTNIIVVAIENKKLARQQLEQEAFRKELEIARDVQRFLFPEKLPNTDTLKIEASYLPHDLVGGDYYDYIPINADRFLICVADVSGKGIPAALMMSNFQASLHTLLRQTMSLREVVKALNYQVLESAKGEKFITFFAAIYDIKLKTLMYINAGHNPPILCVNDRIQLLEKGSPVLGAMHPLPFINEGFIQNINHFTLFAYTDGLTETINEENKEFGQQALMDYFQKSANKELKSIHNDIIIDLDLYKGLNAYRDDITMLSCRVQ